MSGTGGDVLGYNTFAYYIDQSHTPTTSNTTQNNWSPLIYTSTGFNIADYGPAVLDLSIMYSVPLYNQGPLSLCWAFCQVMIEDYNAGIVRSNDEATNRAIQIAQNVHGLNWNRGGWPTNAPNIFGESGNAPPSIGELYNALVQHGPIYAYYSSENDSAHLVVITGVDLSMGLIYTNNPWGISGSQSYNEFLFGFAGMPRTMNMTFGFVIYPE